MARHLFGLAAAAVLASGLMSEEAWAWTAVPCPTGLLYSADYYWVEIDGNTAHIGATYALVKGMDFAPVYFTLAIAPGAQLTAGAEIGTIDFVPAAYPVIVPGAGKLLEENQLLNGNPDLMATDPYGEGWLYRITLTNAELIAMADNLMNAQEFGALLAGNCSS